MSQKKIIGETRTRHHLPNPIRNTMTLKARRHHSPSPIKNTITLRARRHHSVVWGKTQSVMESMQSWEERQPMSWDPLQEKFQQVSSQKAFSSSAIFFSIACEYLDLLIRFDELFYFNISQRALFSSVIGINCNFLFI